MCSTPTASWIVTDTEHRSTIDELGLDLGDDRILCIDETGPGCRGGVLGHHAGTPLGALPQDIDPGRRRSCCCSRLGRPVRPRPWGVEQAKERFAGI